MFMQKRFVKVVSGSKKAKELWEGFRPDKSPTGTWNGRTHAEAIATGDNVAMLTGWGLYVIDVDTKNGDGIANWEKKKVQYNLPDTFTVKTPSGGFHFYFAVPPDAGLHNSAFWGEHIDCRADGGYVLCPPSKLDYTKDDGSIEQKSYSIFYNFPIAELPAPILYQIKEHRKEEKAKILSFGFNLDESDNVITVGTRDDMLIRFAGRLVNILPFPSVDSISAILREVYFGHCIQPSQEGWVTFAGKLPLKITGWIEDRRRRLEEKKLATAIGTTTLDLALMADDYIATMHPVRRFPTMIKFIDDAANGGPKEADMGVIVARTKVGKTSALVAFIYQWAKQGFNVLFLEMEMTPEELMHRFMARHTGVSFWDFEQERQNAKTAIAQDLTSWKEISKHIDLVVEPVARIEAGQLADIVARREYLTGKSFDIVCVDYAGQLDGEGDKYWEKANSVAIMLRAYSLQSRKLVMSAVQSNRVKDGVDTFSTMAGGDGLARAATWELFLEPVFEKENVLEANGEIKVTYNSKKPVMRISDTPKVAAVTPPGKTNTLRGMAMKLDIRGRGILSDKREVPFAHSVCCFDAVCYTDYVHWLSEATVKTNA